MAAEQKKEITLSERLKIAGKAKEVLDAIQKRQEERELYELRIAQRKLRPS